MLVWLTAHSSNNITGPYAPVTGIHAYKGRGGLRRAAPHMPAMPEDVGKLRR